MNQELLHEAEENNQQEPETTDDFNFRLNVNIVLEDAVKVAVFIKFFIVLHLLDVHDKLNQVWEEHLNLCHNTDSNISILPELVWLEIDD